MADEIQNTNPPGASSDRKASAANHWMAAQVISYALRLAGFEIETFEAAKQRVAAERERKAAEFERSKPIRAAAQAKRDRKNAKRLAQESSHGR